MREVKENPSTRFINQTNQMIEKHLMIQSLWQLNEWQEQGWRVKHIEDYGVGYYSVTVEKDDN